MFSGFNINTVARTLDFDFDIKTVTKAVFLLLVLTLLHLQLF